MSTIEFNNVIVNNTEFLKPFAFNLTRDNEEAKDLYQETLYKALSNRDKYSEGTNIKAWMYTIMRNIFINNYRRNANQKMIFEKKSDDFLLNSGNKAISNDAETNLGLKEIRNSIFRLPQIFKTPFILYFEGYRYHEIAYALNEPLGTIKSRIHFARKLLKEQISRN